MEFMCEVKDCCEHIQNILDGEPVEILTNL